MIPVWFVQVSVSPAVKPPIVTLPDAMFVSSASVMVNADDSTVALAAFSVYAASVAAVNTGASLTGVIVTVVLVAVLVAAPAPSEFASVTDHVIVRVALVAVGSSDVLEYATDRSKAWYVASDADPVRLSTPVLLL